MSATKTDFWKPQYLIENLKKHSQFVETNWSDAQIQKSNLAIQGFSTDSRKVSDNQGFLALKGDTFDGHDFITSIVDKKAGLVISHRALKDIPNSKSESTLILVVKDTLKALQVLGHEYRKLFSVPVLAMTGSNGKTTTKEFTYQIISQFKKTNSSHGSFNNHWGVPMSLLEAKPDTEIFVQEMGMNHAGEITELVKIADPTVVLCTTVGQAHMGYFGSQKAVAQAKEEIYETSSASALRIYNLDNPWTHEMWVKSKKWTAAKKMTFSTHFEKADVYFKLVESSLKGLTIEGHITGVKGHVHIPVFGDHNVVNLMSAATLCLAGGLSPEQIWKTLPDCRTYWGRNQILKSKNGFHILFDGYNANPDSMKALMQNTQKYLSGSRKFAVLAQMRELGDESAKSHEELGELVGATGFDQVYFFGDDHLSFKKGFEKSSRTKSETLKVSADYDVSLAMDFSAQLKQGDIVVVKGSRGLETERFVVLCEPIDFKTK